MIFLPTCTSCTTEEYMLGGEYIEVESTAVDNVVYTGNNKIFKVHTRLRVLQYFYDLPADVYKLYNRRIHVRWRVHRRWRAQQSTTLCTLVTTEYLKYIRGCVYNNIF